MSFYEIVTIKALTHHYFIKWDVNSYGLEQEPQSRGSILYTSAWYQANSVINIWQHNLWINPAITCNNWLWYGFFLCWHRQEISLEDIQNWLPSFFNLGVGELTDQISTDADTFVCKLYDVATAMTSNDTRVKIFCKGKTPQALPPTSDALNLHIKRAHYQTRVWRESVLAKPALPSPVTAGWILDQGQFRPELMSLTPIPQSCTEIVSCGCNEGCSSKKYSCRKGKLICMAACKCTENLTKTCMNKFECVK